MSARARGSHVGFFFFFFGFFGFAGDRLANFLLEGKQLWSGSIELSALLFHAMLSEPEIVGSTHFPLPPSYLTELLHNFF